MKVESVMSKDVARCEPSQTLNDAARIMWERDCGIVPIEEGGRIVGVVTDRDICVAAYTRGRLLTEIPIGDVMAKRIVSCRPSDELKGAEQKMRQAQVHRLPVVDASEQLVGMLALADIARATERGKPAGVTSAELGETVAAICRPRTLEAAPAS